MTMSEFEPNRTILVLKVTQTSEHFLKIDYLCSMIGLANALFRFSPKKSHPNKPEIFDTADILLDLSSSTKTKFIKDYQPIKKRTNIGIHYKQLLYASKFSQFLTQNATHVPDPHELYSLVTRSLDAFENGYAPEIISLKAFYNFLKTEGFPVRATWLTLLPKEQQIQARNLLQTPLDQLNNSPQSDALAQDLLNHLSQWIEKETDFKPVSF